MNGKFSCHFQIKTLPLRRKLKNSIIMDDVPSHSYKQQKVLTSL